MNRTNWMLVLSILSLAIILTAAGGLLDIQESGTLTKQHLWNDGLFLAILAVGIVAYHS